MTLENITEELMQEAMRYGLVDNLKKRYEKSKKEGVNVLDWNVNEVEMLLPIAYGDLSEDEFKLLRNLPTRELDPTLSKAIKPAYESYTQNLAKIVEPEYNSMIDNLSGEYLIKILIETPAGNLSNKNYKDIINSKKRSDKVNKIAEEEDVKGYINFIKEGNEAFAKVLTRVKNEREIKTLIKGRANYEINKYLSYFIDKEGQIDENKVKEYLKADINSLEKKDKDKAYATIGYEFAKYVQNSTR
ncbi:MAG TPA: hypothetical protein P5277_00615 [Candidatus Paceibacterota bacterium]|nr:hypothetical protein [Candidatus Paceibacterota bacterium]